MNNPESVLPRLQNAMNSIRSLKEADANEANTRLQIVDEVLQLLNWEKKEFSPEESTGLGNYTDYIFRVNGSALCG